MARLAYPALGHGGPLSNVVCGVVHDAETPMKAGYAKSIGSWWGSTPGDSAHGMVDPADICQFLPYNVTAWHVGPVANGRTVGFEQAGYAAQTREDWLTPDGLAQMDNLVVLMREASAFWGLPLKMVTDPAVISEAFRTGEKIGWCYHATIADSVGGTDHHDPTPNYPVDVLQAKLDGAVPVSQIAVKARQVKTILEVGMFVAFGPGGARLCGPGYTLNMDAEMYAAMLKVPGMQVIPCTQREFDVIHAACTFGNDEVFAKSYQTLNAIKSKVGA